MSCHFIMWYKQTRKRRVQLRIRANYNRRAWGRKPLR